MARIPRPTTNKGRIRASRFGGNATRLRDPGGKFVQGGHGFGWQGFDTIFENFEKVGDNFVNNTRREAEDIARGMEEYGRANARWEDRTGDARRGLKAVVISQPSGDFSIAFGHSVNYGVFLENGHGGEYAIVEETMLWGRDQLEGALDSRVWTL